ncbi:ABC-2 type transport system ATP-binding protein [Deinobacterium chartae]|uniref:ABC-2 type transport system ATP-binding protein n=1 Tax=Deinobacterium chartae TaxID=521158 RepID=A0A841I4L1_9DEIO|nr:ABC transporter ATP-binding protein [Deinobacterium chartae]MBB6099974.1 ABC-2 type transport system ATP-binding protein [Deinobacterium chartae]
MVTVQLEQVTKHYGTHPALNGLNLEVRAGEVLALLGPNGAGKTTAISLMLGLRPPSGGRVRVFGRDPRDRVARARMGAMLQESDLPATLQVGELIEMFSRLYPAPLPRRTVLELADLGAEERRLASGLSGGQRRRLAFALAVCGDPDLIFLDEPTVAMDVTSRQSFWRAVSDFKARGKTVILTTHHLEEADALSDRVVVIDRGRELVQGSPAQIKAQVGGARIRFRSQQVTLSSLQSLPGVTRASLEGDRAELHSSVPEAALARLLADLTDLTELEVARASLEEAFLTVTAAAVRA